MWILKFLFKPLAVFSLLFVFQFLILSSQFSLVNAQSIDELDRELQQKREQIEELEVKLAEAKKQEKTLNAQLQFIDTQNKITELKIEQTKFQITKLGKEISELGSRITRLSGTVDKISEILINRIVNTYKYTNYTPLELIFASEGFADFLERIKYIQVAQANDKKVLYQLQATKNTYNDQKQDKETRQSEQQKLQTQLVGYQEDLNKQKKQKDELLRVTKNDEAKYQEEIARLRADIASIALALSNVGAKIGPVNKGDVIAAMGSTGCSTGPHLHFEVYENAKVEGGKVSGSRTNPHSYLDNGKLGTPIRGYPDDTTITTEYGEVYFLGTHTGLDIAPKRYEGVGRAILASEKGVAYAVSAPCSYKISGGTSTGKGIIIDHENGTVTLYWHVL